MLTTLPCFPELPEFLRERLPRCRWFVQWRWSLSSLRYPGCVRFADIGSDYIFAGCFDMFRMTIISTQTTWTPPYVRSVGNAPLIKGSPPPCRECSLRRSIPLKGCAYCCPLFQWGSGCLVRNDHYYGPVRKRWDPPSRVQNRCKLEKTKDPVRTVREKTSIS